MVLSPVSPPNPRNFLGGTKSYVPRYSRPLHVYNSRLLSPGYVPSPGYTSTGTNVTFQPSIISAGDKPTHSGDYPTLTATDVIQCVEAQIFVHVARSQSFLEVPDLSPVTARTHSHPHQPARTRTKASTHVQHTLSPTHPQSHPSSGRWSVFPFPVK